MLVKCLHDWAGFFGGEPVAVARDRLVCQRNDNGSVVVLAGDAWLCSHVGRL